MTHRGATIIAVSTITASDSIAAMRPKWGNAQNSRIARKIHPTANMSRKKITPAERSHHLTWVAPEMKKPIDGDRHRHRWSATLQGAIDFTEAFALATDERDKALKGEGCAETQRAGSMAYSAPG